MSLLYDCMIVIVVSIWVIFTTVCITGLLKRVEKLEDRLRKKERAKGWIIEEEE